MVGPDNQDGNQGGSGGGTSSTPPRQGPSVSPILKSEEEPHVDQEPDAPECDEGHADSLVDMWREDEALAFAREEIPKAEFFERLGGKDTEEPEEPGDTFVQI